MNKLVNWSIISHLLVERVMLRFVSEQRPSFCNRWFGETHVQLPKNTILRPVMLNTEMFVRLQRPIHLSKVDSGIRERFILFRVSHLYGIRFRYSENI